MPSPAADVIIRIRSISDNAGFRDASRNLNLLEGNIARVGQASGLLAGRFRNTFLAFAAGVVGTGKVFSDVETAQINLSRVSNLQGKAFTDLAERVKGLAKGLGLTQVQTLNLATTAAKLGIEGADLAKFIRVASQAAQALGQDAETTATQLAKLRANLDLSVDEVNRLTGAVIGLDNVSAAAFPDMLSAMLRVGPAAKVMGLAGQDLAAISAVLLETGIRSEVAGTALQKVFSNLKSRAGDIAPVLGLSVGQLDTMAPLEQLKLLSQAFVQARQNPEQFASLLKALNLSGSRADVVLTVLGSNISRLDELLKASNAEFQRGTLLSRLFGAAAASLAFQFRQMKEGILGAAAAIGQQLAPFLRSVLKTIIAMSDAIRNSPLLQFVAAFTLLSGVIVSLTGFLLFFTAANLVAFKVVKDGLGPVLVRWGLLTAHINSATGAVMRYSLAEKFTFGGAAASIGGFFRGRDTAGRQAALAALGGGAGRAGILGAYLNASALQPIMGAVRTVFSVASRLLLPLSIGLGFIVAIKDNLFGARDALVRMVAPFKELFGGESQGGMSSILKLLRSFVQLLGNVFGILIRVVAEILTPFVKVLVNALQFVDRILGPVADLVGELVGLNGNPQTSGGNLPSLRPQPTRFAVTPGAAAAGNRTTTVNFVNPQVRNNADLERMEEIARRAVRESFKNG